MLETMRRNSRSAIIYVLFGILIAVFVLSFGPGNHGFVASSAASNVAAKVAGSTLTEQDFRFAYIALGGSQYPPQVAKERRLKEYVMDKLIERELLATEAQKLGFLVSQKEVEDMIADGRMMVMGFPRRVDDYVFKGGNFDYERFKAVCQNQLGVSVLRFIEIQRRELLADKLRESMRGGVRVSPAEVKSEFEDKGLQVNLEFVKLSSRKYEVEDAPTPADIEAYAKAHEADLKKIYEERKPLLFTKVEKQAKLRRVFVDVPKDPTAEQVQKAQAKIDDAKKRIDGGAPLAEVSRQLSSVDAVRRKAGEMGWKKRGFTGFTDAIDNKIFAADVKKGAIIGPERSDHGFELILVEDLREGDISYEQAAYELAEAELTRERGKARAKAEAQAILDKVKKGEKLEVLFPPPKDAPTGDGPEAQMARMTARMSDTPSLRETGLFSRRGDMVQDIGVSKELAKQAFELPVGELAGPFEIANGWVLARVKEHKDPDMKDFEKRRADLEREAARSKWFASVDAWAKQRCAEVREGGKIRVNEEILAYDGLPASKIPGTKGATNQPYVPCATRAPF